MKANSILEIELDEAVAKDLRKAISGRKGIVFKLTLDNELVLCDYVHMRLNDGQETIFATIPLEDAVATVLKTMLNSTHGYGTMLHINGTILALSVVLVDYNKSKYINIARTSDDLHL